MGSFHRSQEKICSKKGEYISIVKNKERGDTKVCEGKEIYLTIEIITDITSVLYVEEGWEEEDSAGLLIFEQLNTEQLDTQDVMVYLDLNIFLDLIFLFF